MRTPLAPRSRAGGRGRRALALERSDAVRRVRTTQSLAPATPPALLSCDRDRVADPARRLWGGGTSPSTPTPTTTPPPGGAGFTYNGITHVSWWHDEYGYPAGSDARRALAGTGAGWAGLLVTWYMDTRSSNAIAPHPDQSNDDDVVRRAIDEMQALGLKVMLKPHVDVRDGTWRAQITPTDPGRWFASYSAFLDHTWRRGGEERRNGVHRHRARVDVGLGHAAQWASLIARIRAGTRAPHVRRQRRRARRRVHERVVLGPAGPGADSISRSPTRTIPPWTS